MSTDELVLVDLSSIAYPIWHMSQSEPDPNHTSTQIVKRVRELTADSPYAAICCDCGRSFRKDIAASYKANRPEAEAPLHHQIDLAKEQLAADGFPVWAVKGFEADDVIASATHRALETEDLAVRIISSDKDLLQLVGPRVTTVSATSGDVYDAVAVHGKFGVHPSQMIDYLSLVGDASDNIKGAQGIGPKRAADLLMRFGSLEALYLAMHDSVFPNGEAMTPALRTSLFDFEKDVERSRALIQLATDVAIPFEEIAVERVAKDVPTMEPSETEKPTAQTPLITYDHRTAPAQVVLPPASPQAEPDYEHALDPRSMTEAITLANHMHASRMFSAYGTPQAVLSTIMVGRELGLPAMASLRTIHCIEGKHALGAALMVALVLKSGLAEYFKPISFSTTEATFETQRKGQEPVRLTHTIEMAQQAGLIKLRSNWERIPTDMLMARAQSRLARLVYPDILAGLYSPEELAEARMAAA